MAKKPAIDEEDFDLNTEAAAEVLHSGMASFGEVSSPVRPCYEAGTAGARRAASNAVSFLLETEEHGVLFVDRGGYVCRYNEEDDSAGEKMGRVSDFIDVPLKTRKARRKKDKKTKKS